VQRVPPSVGASPQADLDAATLLAHQVRRHLAKAARHQKAARDLIARAAELGPAVLHRVLVAVDLQDNELPKDECHAVPRSDATANKPLQASAGQSGR